MTEQSQQPTVVETSTSTETQQPPEQEIPSTTTSTTTTETTSSTTPQSASPTVPPLQVGTTKPVYEGIGRAGLVSRRDQKTFFDSADWAMARAQHKVYAPHTPAYDSPRRIPQAS